MINEITIDNFIKKNKNFFILLLWLISSIFFYFYIYNKYGEPPRYGMFDWNRYYDGANYILKGKLPDFPSYYFFSYCLYLALSIKIIFPYFTLLIAIILNLISSFLIFNITKKLFSNFAALICLIIFLFFPYYQMWVFFIQPVTFFSFCLLLVAYTIINIENIRYKFSLLTLSLILVFTSRPNGISEIVSVYIFLILFYLKINKNISFFIFLAGIPIISFLLIYLSKSMSIQNIYNAWFVTELKEFGFENEKLNLPTKNFENCLGLTKNEIQNLNSDNAPISNINFWICSTFTSPIEVLKIFMTRIFLILSFYKPVLSAKHNFFSLITLIPMYILFLIGFFKNIHIKKIFILISLLLVFATIAIHTVDGDNRVYSSFLPFIFIISSGGFFYLLKQVKFLY